MDGARTQVLGDIDALLDAARRLRESLNRAEAINRRIRRRVERGERLDDILSPQDNPPTRHAVDHAFNSFEEARHRLRRSLVLLGRCQGLSLAELAKLWGVSRTLISRYVNESGSPASETAATDPA